MIIKENIDKLLAFSELQEDWDSENGLPFSDKHIEKVKAIIEELPIQPKIFPTGRGSIQLEYENQGIYLEFEIHEDKTAVLLMEGDHSVFEQTINEREKEKIYNIVRKFIAS